LKPGLNTLSTTAFDIGSGSSVLTIEVDRSFSTPGDTRELGIIVQEAGFR
jgi:hypothetical protein